MRFTLKYCPFSTRSLLPLITCTIVLATACVTRAAVSIDFEELSFNGTGTGTGTTGSYWDGSDNSGGFTSQNVRFNNSYNSSWYSWSGWAYSDVCDDTTGDYTNQYAAFPGSGAG